jgi:hypothetical protein
MISQYYKKHIKITKKLTISYCPNTISYKKSGRTLRLTAAVNTITGKL